MKNDEDVAKHLQRWPGLFLRQGLHIIESSPEDQAIAHAYPHWPDKGPLQNGQRITLLARDTTFHVDEEIHILHVHEVITPGGLVHVMGPKPVYDEYLDDRLVTPESPPGDDPFDPSLYNGRAIPSPAVDYNFEITTYRFSAPGRHRIDWRAGGLRSNTLILDIRTRQL